MLLTINIVRDQKARMAREQSTVLVDSRRVSVRDVPHVWELWHTAFHGLNSKMTFIQTLSVTPTLYPSECSELLPAVKTHHDFRASVDPMELIPETPSQNPRVLQERHTSLLRQWTVSHLPDFIFPRCQSQNEVTTQM